jgi:serine/threonine protein kinase
MDHKEFRERYQYDAEKDLLGVGGFGRVVKARDLLLDRWVALKIFSRDEEERYNLISEIRRAIDLNHPNICRYHGAEVLKGANALGETQTIQVGVMEFVEGGTIDRFLANRPEFRKKLLADVLRGLSYLHRHQPPIIHRDLKPPNVLVGFEDGTPVAKITDLGISKSVSASSVVPSQIIGTLAYMAPEQLYPDQYGVNGKIHCNLDLWCYGTMMIELLTGVLPFGAGQAGASTGQTMEAITRGIPAHVLNGFEEPYRSVLRLCMVPESGKRAQSADELLRLLEAPPRTFAEPHSKTVVEEPGKHQTTVDEKAWARTEPVTKPTPEPPPEPLPEPDIPTPEPRPKKSLLEMLTQFNDSMQRLEDYVKNSWLWWVGVILSVIFVFCGILGIVAEFSLETWGLFAGTVVLSYAMIAAWGTYHSWRGWIQWVFIWPGAILTALTIGLMIVPFACATLYTSASWFGNLQDVNNLGDRYLTGDGYLRDPARAVDLLSQACNGSVTAACVRLAEAYLGKYEVTQNYQRSAALYSKACDAGNVQGCVVLGYLYDSGFGVAKDLSRAAALYARGCNAGVGLGCSDLGNCYHYGRGVKKDTGKAKELLTKGCKMGNQWGCDRLKEMQ